MKNLKIGNILMSKLVYADGFEEVFFYQVICRTQEEVILKELVRNFSGKFSNLCEPAANLFLHREPLIRSILSHDNHIEINENEIATLWDGTVQQIDYKE